MTRPVPSLRQKPRPGGQRQNPSARLVSFSENERGLIVAQTRPIVSHDQQPLPRPLESGVARSDDAPATDDLVGIVTRASRLGHSPWRVGVALRVRPIELAWICARLTEQDARPKAP